MPFTEVVSPLFMDFLFFGKLELILCITFTVGAKVDKVDLYNV